MTTTKNDWKNLKFFENSPVCYECNISLTDEEASCLLNGFKPVSMDDKWFSYSEDNTVYFHRSWTGHLIYKFKIANNSITRVDMTMDDTVNMTEEKKIDVFHRVLKFLSNQDNHY